MLTTRRDGPILRLAGELELATIPVLDAALKDLPTLSELSVDMSAVEFMDSSGLRALLGLRDAYAQVVVLNPSRAVERIIELTLTERLDGLVIRHE